MNDKSVSYHVYLWLGQQRFAVVHYPAWRLLGFWAVNAKQQGLAFADTLLVCHVHGQTMWHLTHSSEFLNSLSEIEIDYLERRSVERADLIFSPSRYMIDYMTERGWDVPKLRFVAPNLLPVGQGKTLETAQMVGELRRAPVSEIVFFGRIETRKGIDLFLEEHSTRSCRRRPSRRS